MNNKCKKNQDRIMKQLPLSEKELAHMVSCPECRDFAALSEAFGKLPAPEMEVPEYLDQIILRAAEEGVSGKRKPKLVVWKAALSAAAVFALAAGLLFYQIPVNTGSSQRSEIAEKAEGTFDDQIIALAMDVGSEANLFSETFDLII